MHDILVIVPPLHWCHFRVTRPEARHDPLHRCTPLAALRMTLRSANPALDTQDIASHNNLCQRLAQVVVEASARATPGHRSGASEAVLIVTPQHLYEIPAESMPPRDGPSSGEVQVRRHPLSKVTHIAACEGQVQLTVRRDTGFADLTFISPALAPLLEGLRTALPHLSIQQDAHLPPVQLEPSPRPDPGLISPPPSSAMMNNSTPAAAPSPMYPLFTSTPAGTGPPASAMASPAPHFSALSDSGSSAKAQARGVPVTIATVDQQLAAHREKIFLQELETMRSAEVQREQAVLHMKQENIHREMEREQERQAEILRDQQTLKEARLTAMHQDGLLHEIEILRKREAQMQEDMARLEAARDQQRDKERQEAYEREVRARKDHEEESLKVQRKLAQLEAEHYQSQQLLQAQQMEVEREKERLRMHIAEKERDLEKEKTSLCQRLEQQEQLAIELQEKFHQALTGNIPTPGDPSNMDRRQAAAYRLSVEDLRKELEDREVYPFSTRNCVPGALHKDMARLHDLESDPQTQSMFPASHLVTNPTLPAQYGSWVNPNLAHVQPGHSGDGLGFFGDHIKARAASPKASPDPFYLPDELDGVLHPDAGHVRGRAEHAQVIHSPTVDEKGWDKSTKTRPVAKCNKEYDRQLKEDRKYDPLQKSLQREKGRDTLIQHLGLKPAKPVKKKIPATLATAIMHRSHSPLRCIASRNVAAPRTTMSSPKHGLVDQPSPSHNAILTNMVRATSPKRFPVAPTHSCPDPSAHQVSMPTTEAASPDLCVRCSSPTHHDGRKPPPALDAAPSFRTWLNPHDPRTPADPTLTTNKAGYSAARQRQKEEEKLELQDSRDKAEQQRTSRRSHKTKNKPTAPGRRSEAKQMPQATPPAPPSTGLAA
eukprot:gene7148-1276_t